MSLKLLSTISCSLLLLLVFTGGIDALPQNSQAGYIPKRIPILYEAYYPEPREPREWSPARTSLQEIEKLRQLTSQLLKEEEQLSELAAAEAAEASPENIYEPRGQILEYVFSRPAVPVPAPAPVTQDLQMPVQPVQQLNGAEDDVQVTSLTVSDAGRHRTRHHHGDPNWMQLRRVSRANTDAAPQ